MALSISCVRPKFLKISSSSLVSLEHDFIKKSQLKSPVAMSSLFSALADSRTYYYFKHVGFGFFFLNFNGREKKLETRDESLNKLFDFFMILNF